MLGLERSPAALMALHAKPTHAGLGRSAACHAPNERD